MSAVIAAFEKRVPAIDSRVMIERKSLSDKEFHFQNWVKGRLDEVGGNYETGGRNTYPDFRMVLSAEGFEAKGLAYPGRHATYDSNSQAPTGFHNGHTIYYVFGRYPKDPDGNRYPVMDMVVCHGDFLNADRKYIHENKSVRGFGSYGDIMIRDRKMYTAPTPFDLTTGTAHQQTLIVPADAEIPDRFKRVGTLTREEASRVVVGYEFDLTTNNLMPKTAENPMAGIKHTFGAWRLKSGSDEPVSIDFMHNPNTML